VSQTRVRGWAFDSANPAARVRLDVLVDGALIGHVLANRPRGDLARAGTYGDGRHGFDFRLPAALEPGQSVEVRRAADALALPGSPRRVAAEPFDAAARADLARRLRGVAEASRDPALLDELTGFLRDQADSLRGARALLDGGQRAEVEDPRDPLRGLALADGAAASVQPLALVLDAAADAGALARMESLQRLGFQLRFMAWRQQAGDTADPSAAALAAAGIPCLGTAWGGVEEVLRRLGDRLDLVLLQGAATAATYAVLVRRFCPQARLVFGATDAAGGFEHALAAQLAHATLPPGADDLAAAAAPVLRRWASLAA
jgi:hypothetical protein